MSCQGVAVPLSQRRMFIPPNILLTKWRGPETVQVSGPRRLTLLYLPVKPGDGLPDHIETAAPELGGRHIEPGLAKDLRRA